MKKFLTFIFFLEILGCAPTTRILVPAPSVLPGVTREMKTAGYWIGRHPSPDKITLDETQVREFNRRLEREGLLNDLSARPKSTDQKALTAELENQFKSFKAKTLFLKSGVPVDKKFFDALKKNLNLKGIMPVTPVRWGFIVHYADERVLPTEEILCVQKGDIDFDETQNSALNAGEPVAILHESLDGVWFYCRGRDTSGWIKKNLIALCGPKDIEEWMSSSKEFVVTLLPKTDIFFEQDMLHSCDHVQMGAMFPLVEKTEDQKFKILFPMRGQDGNLIMTQGYIEQAAASQGYLKYTPRAIIEQAFKLLNAPYGWGGMYGEQDCSRFLQEVFATVGIHLPRNSSSQIMASISPVQFDASADSEKKLQVLKALLPGQTILYLKGHIMLFLGMVKGEPYAIHATYSYRENKGREETVHVINKVVVSNLSLGQDSKKGSLLSRLIAAGEIWFIAVERP